MLVTGDRAKKRRKQRNENIKSGVSVVVPCNSSTWEAEAEACSVGLPLLHIGDSYVTSCVEQHNSNKQTPENHHHRWRQFWNDNQDGKLINLQPV